MESRLSVHHQIVHEKNAFYDLKSWVRKYHCWIKNVEYFSCSCIYLERRLQDVFPHFCEFSCVSFSLPSRGHFCSYLLSLYQQMFDTDVIVKIYIYLKIHFKI